MKISDFRKKDQENKNISGNLLNVTIEEINHYDRKTKTKTSIRLKDVSGSILLEIWDKKEYINENFKVGDIIKVSNVYSVFDEYYKSYIIKLKKNSEIEKKKMEKKARTKMSYMDQLNLHEKNRKPDITVELLLEEILENRRLIQKLNIPEEREKK